MTLPKDCHYRDIHGDMKVSKLSTDRMAIYLEQFDKKLDKGNTMYKEGFLRHIRVATNTDITFFKSVCRAEYSKSVTYQVDISLDKQGFMKEAQCDCAAGMGPGAHCKHVCAVMMAVVDFSSKGDVILEKTCTQKLQTFHQAKKFKGSPLKAKNISMSGADDVTDFDFDPRPKKFQKHEGYNDYFRNVCLNFKGCSEMPVFQLFPPANAKAVAHDHDYFEKSHEDNFLDLVNVTNIDEATCRVIEQKTRNQSSSRHWKEERSKRLCSSSFGKICKATERCDKNKLAMSLTCSVELKGCKAVQHGRKYEKAAIEKYEQDKCVNVQKCGLFVSKTKPFLGSSPDGIINSDMLIEVKCPYSAKNKEITSKSVPYLIETDKGITLNPNHDYYYQIQGQLFCAERKECDLVVYTISDIKYIRIARDEKFIQDMITKLESFFNEYFKIALLEKCYYKPMP